MYAVTLIVMWMLLNHQQNLTQGQSLISNTDHEISFPSSTSLPHHRTDTNLTIAELCYHLWECSVDEKSLIGNATASVHVHINAGFCITAAESELSMNYAIGGYCPYFSQTLLWDSSISQYVLPIGLTVDAFTDFTCSRYNREGELCRKCKVGYGPAVYAFSLMCAECQYSPATGWVLYFFCVLFPITVFYVFVIVFNIRATAPPFSAFILMSQTFCMMELTYVPLKMRLIQLKSLLILLQIVRVLCGFWNLDFFRYLVPPFCVSIDLSTFQALSLEYVHVIYPLLLIFLTFVCIELHARNCTLLTVIWKPFHKCITRLRRSLDPRASIVNAFSTFLFLNLSKLIFVARNFIYVTEINVYHVDSKLSTIYRSFLYVDPNIHQYSRQHIPYLSLSVIVLVVFCAIPTVLFCLYPTKFFRRPLRYCLPLRWQYGLDAFMDTFQGYYKDGSNGTRDYRAASSVHLVLVFIIVYRTINLQHYVRGYVMNYTQLCLVAGSLFYALARPCKKDSANIIQSLVYALTAVVIQFIVTCSYRCAAMYNYLTMLLCLLIPHVILCGYVVYKITKRFNINYSYLWKIASYKPWRIKTTISCCFVKERKCDNHEYNVPSTDEYSQLLS